MGYTGVTFPEESTFLVTGAAGFIGSNLIEVLLKLGCHVKAIDNFSNGKRQNIEGFLNHKKFEFIEGDIRDLDLCKAACRDVDYVLHQAALGSVPRSMKEPAIYEDNNIKGTANMMEAARINGVKRFVYASSSSVYGDSSTLPKIEGKEGNVLSPYALTKKVNEQYGKMYTDIYGLECIGLRYFNVFGKRQDPDSQYAAVIPKFIKAIKHGRTVEIYGDGEQSRDFTYIENVIDANLKACQAPKEACGEAYNIAFGERITINQLCALLAEHLGNRTAPVYKPSREGDIKHSLADITKARKSLRYAPLINTEEGLRLTIGWYAQNL